MFISLEKGVNIEDVRNMGEVLGHFVYETFKQVSCDLVKLRFLTAIFEDNEVIYGIGDTSDGLRNYIYFLQMFILHQTKICNFKW